MGLVIGHDIKLQPGMYIWWDPETQEIVLKDDKHGYIYWESANGAIFPANRGFIQTEWQFVCLADLITQTHGLSNSSPRRVDGAWRIEFLKFNDETPQPA
jgi:hypothetical protein